MRKVHFIQDQKVRQILVRLCVEQKIEDASRLIQRNFCGTGITFNFRSPQMVNEPDYISIVCPIRANRD